MSYFDITQTFMEDSKKAINLTELTIIFHNLITKLGFTNFVCMSHVDALNPPEDAVVLCNYPLEWAVYHSEQKYHKLDPVQQTCRTQLTPFTWSNAHWRYLLNRAQTNIMNEAGDFGLIQGHTIPINPPTGYNASLSLVFEPGNVDPEALNALHLIAFFLYETAIQMKTNELGAVKPINKLSDRRRKILELIAQGKSNSVIGDLLNISESTVKDHIQRIYIELNVSSRTQAAVKGLFEGMIRYQDVQVSPPINSNEKSGFVHLQP